MHPDVDHGFNLGSSCLSAALAVWGGIPGKTRQKSKPAAQRIEGMSGIINGLLGACVHCNSI